LRELNQCTVTSKQTPLLGAPPYVCFV